MPTPQVSQCQNMPLPCAIRGYMGHVQLTLQRFLNMVNFWTYLFSDKQEAAVDDTGPRSEYHVLTNVALGSLLFLGHGCYSNWVSQLSDTPMSCPPLALISCHHEPSFGEAQCHCMPDIPSPFSLTKKGNLYVPKYVTTESQRPFSGCVSWGTFK